MLERVDNQVEYLATDEDEALLQALRRSERTGRVLGSTRFIQKLERTQDRPLRTGKPGPKPKTRSRVK